MSLGFSTLLSSILCCAHQAPAGRGRRVALRLLAVLTMVAWVNPVAIAAQATTSRQYPMTKPNVYIESPLLLERRKKCNTTRLNQEEEKLFHAINYYRRLHQLPGIPLSSALNYVAQQHAMDLRKHKPYNERCSLHSWSTETHQWQGTCIVSNAMTQGQQDSSAVDWSRHKAAELTHYQHPVYELVYSAYYKIDPDYPALSDKIIEAWKHSDPHNDALLNLGQFSGKTWKAMGIGIYKDFATVWFGDMPDDTYCDPITRYGPPPS